ncbi:MAG: aspartate carbamoyltransferase regulatory subunit [Thermoprotei archaeon]|nr:MAG: aspartate carbamoyltransferase regulatory subunit [Thermoprotei archaeon]
MSKELIVSKIRNGTVIDHIPAGKALTVLRILGITGREGVMVAIVMNVDSKKLGRKDIVKIENRELTAKETDMIALIAPTATINIIRDFMVIEKRKVVVPSVVKGLLKCPNPTCVTRIEPIETVFETISTNPLILRCVYCGSELGLEEVETQLVSSIT